MMQLTPYPDIDELGISDVDLLAATTTDVDDEEFDRLHALYLDLVNHYPEWDGRVEIAYLSIAGPKTFKTQERRIAVISPGEPFHFKEAGSEWLINWWQVRERGLVLCGPDPRTLTEPISREESLG